MLHLYNTLNKKKEQLTAQKNNTINLYVCGMTVYDHCHIGHARVWVVFDILVRQLKQLNFKVNYVRNITDVDDKIIQRAHEQQQSIQTLTQTMIESMHQDMKALQLLLPTYEPRATHYIAHMIQLIQTLLKKGYAYQVPLGDVYYSVKQFKPYGEFAHQNLQDLMVGARINQDIHKKDPLDFVLWKYTGTQENSWQSPWGWGRPGWHIECSTMAMKHLTLPIDIHGGGADLQFPHHQNEIAQSEAASNKSFVKSWMHVGFVQIGQDKMSKSKGNALSVKMLLGQYSGEVIRYFLLTSHYRSPIFYSETNLNTAQKSLKRLYQALQYVQPIEGIEPSTPDLAQYEQQFYQAINDDLNTPVALSILFDLSHTIHRLAPAVQATQLANLLKKLGGLLGLLQQNMESLSLKNNDIPVKWIEEQLKLRGQAREHKKWSTADAIRLALLEKGIIVEDTSEETKWHYV